MDLEILKKKISTFRGDGGRVKINGFERNIPFFTIIVSDAFENINRPQYLPTMGQKSPDSGKGIGVSGDMFVASNVMDSNLSGASR